MTSPLDIAAHIAVTKRNLENVQDRARIDPTLDEALSYAGIPDLASLRVRQAQGLSVYGVLKAYPVGTQADLTRLIAAIKAINLVAPIAPTGNPIVPGEGWSIPGAEISVDELQTLQLEDLLYTPPLQ